MASIHSGDIGTVIELTVKDENGVVLDISGATVKQMHLKIPSGTLLYKTASFSSSGTDGRIRFTTAVDDIPEAGTYYVDAYLELGSSVKFHTSAAQFTVDGILV